MTTESQGAPGAGDAPASGTPANPADITAAANPAEAVNITPDAKPAASADAPSTVAQYEKTGDPGLDMALDFVGRMGITPDDVAMVEAGKGNFALLRAKMAALGDKAKGFEAYIALGEQGFKAEQAKVAEKATKDRAIIENAVGGAEQLTNLLTWAKENAEPQEVADVNAAFKQGGMVAKAMAVYLNGLYAKASGTEITPASALAPGAAGKSSPAAGPLTVAAFAAETQKLYQKHGQNFENTPEYKALAARRTASRRTGV